MKKQITIYLLVAVVAIGVIFGSFWVYQLFTKKVEVTQTTKICNTENNGKTIVYKGKEGSSALSLLQESCQTETKGSGESAYITKINGIEANSSNEFWSFKVNGEMAQVGAGSYITKDTESITWELSSF
ncbi:MAG: DUF4430 domain-containing protein [Candidatus Saccharibacteria bacterium]